MSSGPVDVRSRIRSTLVVALVASAIVGCASAAPDQSGRGAEPTSSVVSPPTSHPDLSSFSASGAYERPAEPVQLSIPRIGVASGLERLGYAQDRTLEVPVDANSAGWFTDGARPGEPAPAILLGHVDSDGAPAVFFRLHELVPGDEIVVDRADESTVTFHVTHVERHAKAAFPTDAVYSPSGEAELRLITCGGAFDPAVGHYRDNVIVFAALA